MIPRHSTDPPLASAGQLFDIEAVNINTGMRRKLAEQKTLPDAAAIVKMALARRGVEEEFYEVVQRP